MRIKDDVIFADYRWTSLLTHILSILSVIPLVLRILFKHIINFIHVFLINLSVILLLVRSILGTKGCHYIPRLGHGTIHVLVHAHFYSVNVKLLSVCLDLLSAHIAMDVLVRDRVGSLKLLVFHRHWTQLVLLTAHVPIVIGTIWCLTVV